MSKFKHSGFTMAEILLTLGIIGVIAMFTLPALMNNIQKQQAGPALIKAMGVLETAHALMINEHDMFSLKEGCGLKSQGSASGHGAHHARDDEFYINNCFEPYIKTRIGAHKETKTMTYKDFNGQNVSVNVTPTTSVYTTKNGVSYIFLKAFSGSSSGKYYQACFYIDINGINKKPNQLGRDLFKVFIHTEDQGQITAYGSHMFNDIKGGNPTSQWETTCNSTTKQNKIKGDTCSGSIIDNNGKVIYKWP